MPGPVWHSSAAARGLAIPATLEAEALRQLAGVGDPGLGEWREWTGRAFHIRRRLTPAEQAQTGPVVDIRCTPEAARRAAALGPRLALAGPEILEDEIGAVT